MTVDYRSPQFLIDHINNILQFYKTKALDPDGGFYQNYYDNQIRKIENKQDRQLARRLIEEDMIFEEEERRLSIYEGQIFRKGVNKGI